MDSKCDTCEYQGEKNEWLWDEGCWSEAEIICAKSLDMEIDGCPAYEEWMDKTGPAKHVKLYRKGWQWRTIMDFLGDHTLGDLWGDVPLKWASTHLSYQECEYVAAFGNDAFELMLGYPDRWRMTLPRQVMLRFALWYLWKWSWSEWFGLRRRLWYWALHRHCRHEYPWWYAKGKK